jgi:hypothetical protein
MIKSQTRVWGFILGWAFLMILLAFFVQSRDYYGTNPIVRQRLAVKEAFQAAAAAAEPQGAPETAQPLQPAEATIKDQRRPYTLLDDVLTPIQEGDTPSPASSFTAERCHASDFQARLELTGNYRQLTNNYRRASPDSCSAPLQEKVLGYYQPPPF